MQNCLADRIIHVFTALSTFLLSFGCVAPIGVNSWAWSETAEHKQGVRELSL